MDITIPGLLLVCKYEWIVIVNSLLICWGATDGSLLGAWTKVTLPQSYSDTNYLEIGTLQRVGNGTASYVSVSHCINFDQRPKTVSSLYLGSYGAATGTIGHWITVGL